MQPAEQPRHAAIIDLFFKDRPLMDAANRDIGFSLNYLFGEIHELLDALRRKEQPLYQGPEKKYRDNSLDIQDANKNIEQELVDVLWFIYLLIKHEGIDYSGSKEEAQQMFERDNAVSVFSVVLKILEKIEWATSNLNKMNYLMMREQSETATTNELKQLHDLCEAIDNYLVECYRLTLYAFLLLNVPVDDAVAEKAAYNIMRYPAYMFAIGLNYEDSRKNAKEEALAARLGKRFYNEIMQGPVGVVYAKEPRRVWKFGKQEVLAEQEDTFEEELVGSLI